MTNAKTLAAEFLTLPDPDYAGLDESRVSAMSLDLNRKLKPAPPTEEFIVVGAPKRGLIDASSKIPLLVGVRYSELTDWMCDIQQNAVLAATRLSDGQVTLAFPFLPVDKGRRLRELPPSRSGPPPGRASDVGYHTGVRLFDLRRLLPDLVKQPSRLSVRMIYHGLASNGARVELLSPDTLSPRGQTTVRRSPFIKPHGTSSDAAETSLRLPSSVSRSEDLQLTGVVNAAENELPAFPDEQGALISPVSFLFLKLDDKAPLVLRALVPVRLEQGRLRGSFSLSAGTAWPHADLRGAYQVYLFAGAQVAGPFPLDVRES